MRLGVAWQVGVSEGRLRKWLLSISAFLRNQNGSILDAMSLWKANVDQTFQVSRGRTGARHADRQRILQCVVHCAQHLMQALAALLCVQRRHAGVRVSSCMILCCRAWRSA